MSAISNSLNAHNFLIFQPKFDDTCNRVSKFMVYRALSDKNTYNGVAVPFNP